MDLDSLNRIYKLNAKVKHWFLINLYLTVSLLLTIANSLDPDQTRQNLISSLIVVEVYSLHAG